MVNINFTLFIQLGLFLIFLWGTHRFILTPVLRIMDGRDEKLADDKASASKDNETAEELETRYSTEVRRAKRSVHDEVREAHRAEQQKHQADIMAHRQKSEQAIGQVRQEAMSKVEQERTQYAELAPQLADEIAKQFGLGGTAQ